MDRQGVVEAARGAKIAGYGSRAGMRWPQSQSVDFLLDGDHLPGAPEREVIAAPGHTDDSTAFWHERTRTLLSGDAVLSVGGQAWVTPETVDVVANATTSERLRRRDVSHLLPGHGRPVHGESVLAAALNPSEGPKGFTAFSSGLLRCLSGRVRLYT
jgi:glyoxylase-like metal-dependent hydrolase (beta-lactamase superfamily II)